MPTRQRPVVTRQIPVVERTEDAFQGGPARHAHSREWYLDTISDLNKNLGTSTPPPSYGPTRAVMGAPGWWDRVEDPRSRSRFSKGTGVYGHFDRLNKAVGSISPAPTELYVDVPLTTYSEAFMQTREDFVADRVFPSIDIMQQSGQYWRYPRGEFWRDEVFMKVPGAPVARTNYQLESASYLCSQYGLAEGIPDEDRANLREPLELDVTSTDKLLLQCMIRREKLWVDEYLTNANWTFNAEGNATRSTPFNPGASSSNNRRLMFWSRATSTPIQDIRYIRERMKDLTAYKPNVLVLGEGVYNVLLDHPQFIARLDRGQTPGGPAMSNIQVMQEMFDLEKVLVFGGVENTAPLGVTASYSRIGGKTNGLLVYAPDVATLKTPTAGLRFNWTGFLGSHENGTRVRRWYDMECESTLIEVQMAFSFETVSLDLGCRLTGMVERT